jgi:hypothetical protein
MITTIFDSSIREFATRKAAEKFARRVVGGAYVKPTKQSFVDMFHKSGKVVYHVYAQGD